MARSDWRDRAELVTGDWVLAIGPAGPDVKAVPDGLCLGMLIDDDVDWVDLSAVYAPCRKRPIRRTRNSDRTVTVQHPLQPRLAIPKLNVSDYV